MQGKSPQKVPKGGKNVKRGDRETKHTQAMRPERVKRARARHLRQAARSCSKAYAAELERFYRHNPAGKKCSTGKPAFVFAG